MQAFNLNFIKTRRESMDISLQEMAEEMGFRNASTYFKYENGIYSFKANHLPVLSKVLKCKISDFFEQKISKTAI